MNPEIEMTLDEAVQSVLVLLTGLDVTQVPEFDRYYVVTNSLNRALRANSLEVEWSYYSGVENVGRLRAGDRGFTLSRSLRPRLQGDDACRLVDRNGDARGWAYALPRESLHKYSGRNGLWFSVTRREVSFSRAIRSDEAGLELELPVMRAPIAFRLPKRGPDPRDTVPKVPAEIREQIVDFDWPDLIVMRAAMYFAMSNALYQPRVQMLEDQHKDMMYQLKERDESHTDSPFQNEFILPMQSDIYGGQTSVGHMHPHADERSYLG